MSTVYCPLCGIILLQDPYQGDEPDTTPRTTPRTRPWYAEVRAIVATQQDKAEHRSLTGLGLVRGETLFAPVESDRSYVDGGPLEEWALCTTSWRPWGFGLHNSCWQLLRLRLSHMREQTMLESVFGQLHCTPCLESSRFDFGHDYDGAAETHKAGLPPSVDFDSHLYADPCVIPSTVYLETAAPSRYGRYDRSPPERVPDVHFFSAFPAELQLEILSYLSYQELTVMRCVSRDLAQLTALDSLSQAYWKSRFLLGQEADFLFPMLAEPRDWRRVFFGTMACLGRNLSLINRRRIRTLIEPIAALIEHLDAVPDPGLHGIGVEPLQTQTGRLQLTNCEGTDQLPSVLDVHRSFSGHVAPIGGTEPLDDGCRLLYHTIQTLRNHTKRIAVSTVQLGARSFISGVGFPTDPGQPRAWVGYHHAATEKWIEVPLPSRIQSISVAFCSQGLRGIKFTFTDSGPTPWVGESHSPGIAHGTLNVVNPCYLVAGLDLFKIVWLGIGGLAHDPDVSRAPDEETHSGAQSHLWTPDIPAYEHLKLSSLLPSLPARPFQPLVDLDFGGLGGSLLSRVARVVFYMEYDPSPVLGVKVIYNNGESVLLGGERGCELSFPIDGANGERITTVGVLHHTQPLHLGNSTTKRQSSCSSLCGLQISTNSGRTATFSTIRRQLDAPVAQLQTTPLDHAITGLVGFQMHHHDPFLRLGLQYQPCVHPRGFLPTAPSPRAAGVIPEAQSQYNNVFSIFIDRKGTGNYQTYASLNGVRRIQASIGIHGRSRSPNRISGLKLDYECGSPVILGQWMQPYTFFELSADEQIQSLTIWVTPLRNNPERPGIQQGQVTAVKIETSNSRSATFRSPEAEPLSIRDLQHQYGGAGEELVSISWILNASFDRVRATVSDKQARPCILLPDQYPPFNEVQKLYFEPIESDCSRGRLVTAKAYFKDTALLGLVFIYASGTTARIGDVETVPDHHQTVHFVENSQIVGMLVGVREGHIRYLKFQINMRDRHNENHTSSYLDIISPLKTNTAKYDSRSAWCKDELTARTFPRVSVNDCVYAPPRMTRLSGLYVRSQGFSCLGGLYEG